MKNKYAHVILIFFLLLFSKSFSQEIEIKGTVSDESGALPGASVIIKGTNIKFRGTFVPSRSGIFSIICRVFCNLVRSPNYELPVHRLNGSIMVIAIGLPSFL